MTRRSLRCRPRSELRACFQSADSVQGLSTLVLNLTMFLLLVKRSIALILKVMFHSCETSLDSVGAAKDFKVFPIGVTPHGPKWTVHCRRTQLLIDLLLKFIHFLSALLHSVWWWWWRGGGLSQYRSCLWDGGGVTPWISCSLE